MTSRTERGTFKKGYSGNPSGRPKGSRHRLGEDFVAALVDDFAQHGPAAIERAREKDPAAYVRVIASILPKELDLRGSAVEDLTDEELAEAIDLLRSRMGGTTAH